MILFGTELLGHIARELEFAGVVSSISEGGGWDDLT
jgi:hypothetical protein